MQNEIQVNRKFNALLFAGLGFLLFLLLLADIFLGSVHFSISQISDSILGHNADSMLNTIVWKFRMPKAITAILAGIALSVSGLQMQTIFRNPLAGPYVLGISSGASLGVALVILGFSGLFHSASLTYLNRWTMVGAAWIGAASVLAIISVLSFRIRDIMTILILGMMFSGAASSIVTILQYFSNESLLKSFVIWTMGSLGGISQNDLWVLFVALMPGFVLAILTIKPLNALLLGETYAITLGVNIRKVRILIFISTCILSGTVTAFCGPIGFIGVAVPHLCRMLFRTASHSILIPASAIVGASVLLASDLISQLPGSDITLPINSVTALVGIPVIVWIVIRNQRHLS